MRVTLWSRVAATLVMLLFTGAALVLHQVKGNAVDPHAGHIMPKAIPAAVTTPAPLPQTGWKSTVDSSANTAQNGPKSIDDEPATQWRSGTGALPHTLTLDTGDVVAVSGLTYLPAPGASGRIGRYRVQASADGTSFADVATGTFADDAVLKTVSFATVLARKVRLVAVTEAGNRNTTTAVAEVNLLGGADPALPRTGWDFWTDSEETDGEGWVAHAFDGDTATMWHTQWRDDSPPLPHSVTIDMGRTSLVSGLAYLPRQDGSRNGTIGRYRIETSTDGVAYGSPVSGAFNDVTTAQSTTVDPRIARYVRLTALSEAGNRGPWTSAAEINVLGRTDVTLPRTGWTVTASDAETARENGAAANVLDGKAASFWHSQWSSSPAKPLPHSLTLDLKTAQQVGGLTYLPRQDGNVNGRIGRYKIESSTDGTRWTDRVASASWPDSDQLQTAVFPAASMRYLRLTALSEVGNRGPWSAAAEINLLGPSGSSTPLKGGWSAPVGFPLVPVAAAMLPNGKVLTWSAWLPNDFNGSSGAKTVTATYDPATGVVTQREVSNTQHDMFCPGISTLPDGRVIVTGGNASEKTSIYNPANDSWSRGPNMKLPRGYQSSTTLGDGRVFTIGGSWSGGTGGVGGTPHKYGEVYSTQNGWVALPNAKAEPMLTNDSNGNGDYRKDNHAWLFAWTGNKVLQAGPSKAMNWYTTTGTGAVTKAGTRGDDNDAMNGNAVMYDTGKILTVGGSPSYENSNATAKAYQLTIDGSSVTTRKVGSMANTRAFHNSVVLPDGKVVVFGGENYAVPFSDNTAVLSAEIWDPATEKFTTLAPAAVPRTYHSVALLMPDGRVFTGGGGLCGNCTTNHRDGEIFTPPNLFDDDGEPASRPVITSAPATAANGADILVATDREVASWAIVRMGTATHSVNTDQRRLSLTGTEVTGGTRLTIPADKGVALPGYWMLFAMDSDGVPSVAKVIKIG
jgi:galactose oxidase